MAWIDDIKSLIERKNIRVVFPETHDVRILEAASVITNKNLGQVILPGNPENIAKLASDNNFDISKTTIIDIENYDRKSEFAEKYYELRKNKGMTLKEAEKKMNDPLYFGAMLVSAWEADCYVGGCANPTADIIRATLQIIGPEKGIKTVSSCTMHILNQTQFGENGIIMFSDTGVVPEPNAEQLADIAISAAKKWERIMLSQSKVAMLSFSTKGSASHPLVDKIVQATKIVQEKNPEILIDGELQLDAAVVPKVGQYKSPGSQVAGQANVLIFPDLNAGNIAYKLIERLGGTIAYGPILQGMSKPCSDLSRGCSARDIIDVACIV
ncbi:phosphate acetyltransferase, partial [bacterium]|nr:phosphate acetyltransferase [bacterium]